MENSTSYLDVSSSSSVSTSHAAVRTGSIEYPYGLTGLVAALFVVGVTGNVCALATYVVSRRLRTPQNAFIISLSVADCLIVCWSPSIIVNAQLGHFAFPHSVCTLMAVSIRSFILIDMLTMAAIGFVRYLSIVHPTSRFAAFRWPQCLVGVVVTWLFGLTWGLFSITPGIGSAFEYDPHMFICQMNKQNVYLTVFSMIFVYFGSVAVLAYCYICIYVTVRRSKRRVASLLPAVPTTSIGSTIARRRRLLHQQRLQESRRQADETRLAVQLAMIIGVFVVCWVPYLITTLVDGQSHVQPQPVYTMYVALIILNSAINPVIYLCYNRLYRHELWRLFTTLLCRCGTQCFDANPSMTGTVGVGWPLAAAVQHAGTEAAAVGRMGSASRRNCVPTVTGSLAAELVLPMFEYPTTPPPARRQSKYDVMTSHPPLHSNGRGTSSMTTESGSQMGLQTAATSPRERQLSSRSDQGMSTISIDQNIFNLSMVQE